MITKIEVDIIYINSFHGYRQITDMVNPHPKIYYGKLIVCETQIARGDVVITRYGKSSWTFLNIDDLLSLLDIFKAEIRRIFTDIIIDMAKSAHTLNQITSFLRKNKMHIIGAINL